MKNRFWGRPVESSGFWRGRRDLFGYIWRFAAWNSTHITLRNNLDFGKTRATRLSVLLCEHYFYASLHYCAIKSESAANSVNSVHRSVDFKSSGAILIAQENEEFSHPVITHLIVTNIKHLISSSNPQKGTGRGAMSVL